MLRLDELTEAVAGLDHPEGVTVTRDGVVYAGGEAGQVYRVDPDSGKVEQVADCGGFLLGLCADAAGLLYVCNVGRQVLQRVDPASGAVEIWSSGAPDRPLINPNWPVFDDAGTLYLTDSGHWKGDDGCILRMDPDGTTSVWTEQSTNFPNGACLSADGRTLYVLESLTPALVAIGIEPDGSAGQRRVVAMLPGTIPDGVCLDTDGTAYVFCYRPDRVLTVAADGTVAVLADDPEGTVLSAPTNGVWLEPDRRRLLMGNLGRWHLTMCEPGATGIPLRYPVIAGSA